MSLTARVLLAAIRVYQMSFSALMPSACKFYPSCSKYAAIALQLHGARHGSWLAVRRLARCHPFTRGGVDLVPEPEECNCSENASARESIFENAGHTNKGRVCNPSESEVRS